MNLQSQLVESQLGTSFEGARVTLYRAMDKHGDTLCFMFSERRNKPAAQELIAQLIERSVLVRQFVSI
jgi:transposase-like protein